MPMSEPRTHDYTKRAWGHDYFILAVFDEGRSLSMIGWGTGIRENDYLLLTNDTGGGTRYRVVDVMYESDPPDMWRVLATFAPREETVNANV